MEIKKKFGVFVNVTIDTERERVLFAIAGRKAHFPLSDIKMNLEKDGLTNWELNVAAGSVKEEFAVQEETGLEIMNWIVLAQTNLDQLIQLHQKEKEEHIKEKNKKSQKKPLRTWQWVIVWIGAIGFLLNLLF